MNRTFVLSKFLSDSLASAGAAQSDCKVARRTIELMTSKPMCAGLIERYMSTCGLRYVRGEHEGEYFGVASVRARRLHVHLELSASFGDVLIMHVTPACTFPVADRARLARFADAWNRQDHHVTAIVHDCSDARRIGICARRSGWIRDDLSLEEFASAADSTVADAIDLLPS